MEGTIFDIKHFAVHDGPGIRQTVFLKGCPLNCWWCHNPESQNPDPETTVQTHKLEEKEFKKEVSVGYKITTGELFKIIKGDEVFFEESGGGVTFSGGEPLMQSDFLIEISNLCQEYGIHTCVDTTGFASLNTIEKLAGITDCFLYDIKILDDFLHKKYTGVPVSQIVSNLLWLDKQNINTILRFPIIPGITNTEKNLSEVKAFINSLKNVHKMDLLPYHNISNGKYIRFNKENKMKDTTALPDEDMQKLKSEFEQLGLEVSIGG